MIFLFQNVTPAPLAGVIDLRTDIWMKQCAFEPGIRYGVVAPSGKGKTTFIHLLYGLRDDFTGEVRIDEEEVKSIRADAWADLRRYDISIVFQDLRLFLRLTARDNLLVKSALYEDISPEMLQHMADRLNVANVLDKPCHTLSYGERQRISIIRALIQPFQWLLLDEPFSHLDEENARSAASLINETVTARKAGIIVTSLGDKEFLSVDKRLQL